MDKKLKEEIMNLLADAECKLFYFMDETNNSDYEEIRNELRTIMEKLHNKE